MDKFQSDIVDEVRLLARFFYLAWLLSWCPPVCKRLGTRFNEVEESIRRALAYDHTLEILIRNCVNMEFPWDEHKREIKKALLWRALENFLKGCQKCLIKTNLFPCPGGAFAYVLTRAF